jgi:hypothetical protein
MHELGITMRAALKRSAVFYKEPEKSSLHASVTFTNNVHLRTDDIGISFVLP